VRERHISIDSALTNYQFDQRLHQLDKNSSSSTVSGSISPRWKNLYSSLYPDVEAIPKEPGDEFLKGHPAVLAVRSDTSTWHPDLVIRIPPIEKCSPSNRSMRTENSEGRIVNGMGRDSSDVFIFNAAVYSLRFGIDIRK
jgi:hypothetical protein